MRFVPDDADARGEIGGRHGARRCSALARPDGEELVVQLDRPGLYGVKCRAGYEVGMVGLIVVGGTAPNWDEAIAVRHPPAASAVFAATVRAGGVRPPPRRMRA